MKVNDKFFARVYILGLDSQFRGTDSIRRLQETGVEVVRFPATDGNEIPDLNSVCDQNVALQLIGRQMSRPEIGCAISHQRIIQDAADFEGEFIVVLEDDTELDVRVSDLKNLPPVKSEKPTLTELITNKRFSLPIRRVRMDGELNRKSPLVYRSISVPTSSRCYVLNEAAIRALQPEQSRIFYLADFPPDYSKKVEFWYTQNPLATDRDTPSIIGVRATSSQGLAEISREVKLIFTWGFGNKKPFSLPTLINFIFFRRLSSLLFRLRRA
jgi:hypothetical protein